MRNSSFFLMLLLAIVGGNRVFAQAQSYESFVPYRYNVTLNGDMLVVGNSILNYGTNSTQANQVYTGSATSNENVPLYYIDIDSDPTTFSSSAASIVLESGLVPCSKVKQAYLYWSAVYMNQKLAPTQPELQKAKFKEVKFKTPSSAGYQTLTGEMVYDGGDILSSNTNDGNHQRAYVYVADVTHLLKQTEIDRGNFLGEYVVANLRAAHGTDGRVGFAGGWTLYVVYENSTLSSKHITLFDGFSVVKNNGILDIPISGFKTIPTGPVHAKIAFSALEGERKPQDVLQIVNGTQVHTLTAPDREPTGSVWSIQHDFFNSKITDVNGMYNHKRPNSTNLFGYDAGIFKVDNPRNTILANNQTATKLRITTGWDVIYPYMFAFGIDVIAPKILIEKKIYKVNGEADVTGGTVNLGDKLRYEIKFRNAGNDDAENLELTDVLSENLIYTDIISSVKFGWNSNPVAGVDYVYNPANHTIKFNVPNHVVKKEQTTWNKISFEVKVPNDCNGLRNACSNRIGNIIEATYKGSYNPSDFQAQSSSSFGTCLNGIEGPSIFIANLGTCVSKRKETLCQKTLDLVAGADFDTYAWTKEGSSTIIGTSQTLKVTETGTYKVLKKKTGCADMSEEIEVVLHSDAQATNPINQYASLVLTCGNDGSDYPQIYLCGTSATKLLQLNTAGAVSYNWQKRNNCTIPATHPDTCPVRDNYGCTWNTVHTGSSYNVSQGGDYRVEINYAGGCVQVFYFRVTKTELTPTVTTRDIICTKQGEITVTHPTSGYQYALRGSDGNIVVNYQNSNKFAVTNPDSYTVLIRQTLPAGSTYTPCIFELPASIIRKNPDLAVAATPLACQNSKGSLQISVSDMFPPYTYVVRNASASGAVVHQVNATDTTNITVPNLNDGNYYVQVTSPDGCALSHPMTINKLPELKATATVKRHLMCGEAVIRVEAQGGTPGPSYGYSIDGGTTYEYNYTGKFYEFTVTAAGTYNIQVTDGNNCSVSTSAMVDALTPPSYTQTIKLTDCGQKASLALNVTNPEGYRMEYSLDDGVVTKTQSHPTFTQLIPGTTYTLTVTYFWGTDTKACKIVSTVAMPNAVTAQVQASAGVSHLVGCGGEGTPNQNKGKVRITNIHGGVAPYTYSFDGGGTWTTTTEMWVEPGTYNIVVRDDVGCEYRTSVKLNPRPKKPVFTPIVTYDCEGKGILNIGTDQGSYVYTYVHNGTTYTTSTISGLSAGTHTVTIRYANTDAPTKNVLFLESFGLGNVPVTTPYINQKYYFEIQNRTDPVHTRVNSSGVRHILNGLGEIQNPPSWWYTQTNLLAVNDGEYAVVDYMNPSFWRQPKDGSGVDHGRKLYINIGNILGEAGAILYQREMRDITPNQNIEFSIKAFNLLSSTTRVPTDRRDPDLTIELYRSIADINANPPRPLISQHIGKIPKSISNTDWRTYTYSLNPGNNTILYAVIRSNSLETDGNDLALDDIYLYQIPEACPFEETIVVTVESDKAFQLLSNTRLKTHAPCHSGTGSYQIRVRNQAPTGYYVSKDGGTWTLETANPFVWDDVSVGNHTVKFRYSATSTDCEVTETFEIKAPPAITVTPIPTKYLGCNPAEVTVTAVASGGTGALTYALESNIGTTPYQSNPSFVINNVGRYTIHVKDINECPASTSFDVTPAPPVTIAVATTSNYCVTTGGTGASITLNVTGTPPFVFRVNGAVHATTNNTSHTLTNLQPNTYIVTVTDAHRCTTTETIKIEPPLRVSASSVQHDITCRPAPNHRGRIQVNLEGGYGSNTYVVKRGTTIVQPQTPVTGTSIIYESDQPGTYTIEITDAKGCKTQVTHTLTQPVPPTFTYTQTNALCNGGRGSITVNVTSGIGGYTYILNGGTPQTSNIFNNLAAGIYTLTVRDAKHCDATVQTVTITEPVAIRGFAGVSQLIGCGTGANADKAKVRITNVTGGVPPYEYRFDGGWVSENEGWMPAGNNQSVWVRDANRCPFEMKVDVPQKLTPPVFTQTAVTYDCHGNGTVTINNNQSTYSYTYSVNGGTPTTTNTLTNLSPGNNIITIKYRQVHHEAQACDFTVTETVQVATDKEFRATAGTITQPSCHGGNDGSAQFTVENFAATGYRYRLNTGAWSGAITNSPLTISNLGEGSHTLTLEHVGGGCIVTVPFKVTQPTALTLTSTLITPQKCSNTGATVRLTAGGGTPPYQYRLGTGMLQSSPDFSSVPHGTQIFTVQDAKGCPATTTVNLVAPKTVSFTATTQNCYSGNNDASIQVNVTDGNGGYKFSINGGAWITPTNPTTHAFEGLSNGTYTIRVLDSYNCTATQTLVIHPKLIMDLQTIDKSCNDGRITVTAQGGNGNYEYGFAQVGAPMPTLGTTNTFAVTTAGNYMVYLKSADCIISQTVSIGTAPAVGATVTANDPACFGSNGTVALTNVTGHAPYTFALKNTVTPTISQTFNNVIATNYTFANVVSGTYSVTVTDRYGCVVTYTATITGKPQITGIIKSTTTNCVTIGSVVPLELTVSQTIIDAYNLTGYDLFYSIDFGGTWSPLNPTNTISGFVTGQQITVWFKTVPSGAGAGATAVCIEKMPTETVPLPLDNLTISTNLATFTNTCTAGGMEVVVGAKGGTGPYKFAILHSASDPIPAVSSTAWVTPTPANGTTHTFTGLVPGRSYRFLVLDNTNCVKENTQNLYENYVPPVHITATKVKPACHGTTTGTIEFTVMRSASSTTTATTFDWEVRNASTNVLVPGLAGNQGMPVPGGTVILPPVTVSVLGTYYMHIKETGTNCEWASANVEMRVLDPIQATATATVQSVTCDMSARILVQNVSGGGGGYEYQLTSPAFVAPIAWTSNNPIEIPRSNINAGTTGNISVTVHVRDQYGCDLTLTTPLTLNVPAPPPVPTGTANSCSEPLSITVSPTGTNYEYALAGPTPRTWQSSVTFTHLVAGNYTVLIKDKTTGCVTTGTTAVTLHPMMQATVQQTKLLGCTHLAEIKIDVTAGSGNYDYAITGAAAVTRGPLPTNPFTYVTNAVGTYQIHLYDNGTTCPAKTYTVTVAPAVQPSFTTTTVSVTCHGGNDGKIFIHDQVTGSTYTYTIAPALVPPATFNSAIKAFVGLSAGTYNITMTDINNGCATTVTVPVGQPAQITSAAGVLTATAFKCTTGNTSDAVVVTLDPTQVTGGTPPYSYQLVYDNGTPANSTDDITVNGTTMTITNRLGGDVKVTITDANGCTNPPATPITVAIAQYDELKTATVAVVNAITCVSGEDVNIVVTSTSGITTKWMYIQSDTPPAPNDPVWNTATSTLFTNLPVGTHRFWVKHIDTDCMISAVHTVKDPNTFVINTPVITNPDCKGGTGSATITLTDATYTGQYQYTVQSGTMTLSVGTTAGGTTTQIISLSNLLAGTYTITVRQQTAPTCHKSYVFTVVEPAIALTASVTTEPITCVAPNTGVIEVINATGGWGDYRYRIGTGAWQSNPRFTGLTAGTYTVQISDKGGAGCISTVSATVVLTNPVPLTATMTIASQNCVAGSGVMSVTVSGGAGEGYTFELFRNGNFHAVLNTTTATTVMFTNLDAGAYHVEVSDVWGCQTITTATLSTTLHTPITNVHATVMKEITCSTPTGGTVSITHSAGHSTNIRYAVTPPGGGATVTQINSGLFTNLLTAGVYTVEVYDITTGCATESVTFELTPAVSPTFTTTHSDVKCNGGADGWFTVDVPQTQQHLDYQVVVTSTATGFVTQTRTVANVPTSLLFKDLSAGVYTVVMTSVRGCVTTDTVTIGEPTVVGVTATTTPFACDPSNLPQPVIITAVGNGGTAPYHYSIDGTDFTNTSGVFTTTDTGVTQTITVYVKDLHGGCATTTTVVVQPFPAIQGVSVVGTNRITCANPETIAVTITGGANQGYTVEGNRISGVGVVSPTTRTIIAGSSTTTFEITEVGMYEFKIIDNHTGCYTVTTYTVHPYNNIEIKVSPKVNTSCYGASDGVITLETTGYLGSYAYRVIDDATSLMVASGTATTTMASLPHRVDIGGLPTGMYKVELTENGIPFCTVTSTLVSVSGPTRALTATATIIAPLTCEGNNAVIDVQAQYGWGNYEYQLWMNGIPHPTYGTYTTTSTFVGLGVGNYEVKVRDMGGCELTASATATMTTITIAPPVPITLNLTSSVTQVSCYGDKSASITAVSVMGGSGNYKYVLISTIGTEVYESGAQDSPTFTNLGAGVYQVKVIDGWGCDQVSTVHITITEPTPVRLNATITKGLTCLTNAEITLVASGGSGTGYTFSTSPTGTFTAADVLSVPMGTYTYYAKDSNGCLSEVSNTIEILPIEPLTLTVDTTDAYVKCNGESTAEIRATAQGGLGNYQFELKGTLADGSVVTRTTLDGIFVGLATGTYQVTLKSDDCVTSTIHPIIINEAPALVWGTATSTDETCFGENNGTIKVMATGGTGSITYAISPRLDRAVTVEFINQQEYAPGTYLVRASDENGCYVDFDVTIQAATRLTAVLDVVTHEICFGAADATASITISGGKAPYHTAFNSNAVSATWTQSNDGRVYYDNLPAGENQVIFVKDANGCSTYVVIPSINAGVDLQLSATAKVECVSANTISSEVIVLVNSNYASLVTYALDGGTPQRNNIFTNVSSGTHTITVAHPNGCTTQTTVFVPHYDPLTVVTSTTQVSCNGESDASIVMQVTGGSASYTYRIAPNIGTFDVTTGTFRGLPAGTYEVSVRDNQLGCVLTEIFTFAEPDVLYVETGSVTETCYQVNDGQLFFEIKGGRPQYAYTLTAPDGTLVESATGIVQGQVISKTGLVPGTYQLLYSDDASLCTKTATIQVGKAPNIEPINSKAIKVQYQCRESWDNTSVSENYIELFFDNTILTASNTFYALNSTNLVDAVPFSEFIGNKAIIRNIPAGKDQYFTIFYKTCTYTIPVGQYFDVEEYDPLMLTDKTDPKSLNTIKVEATGGKAPYTYRFNGIISDDGNEYHIMPADKGYVTPDGKVIKQIDVEVMDDLGCTRTLTIEKEFIDIKIPNYFTPNGDGNNDDWGPNDPRSYPNMTIAIYDRYGRLIAQLEKGQRWDGTYEGKHLPTGDYWYIIRLNEDKDDSREFLGNMTLFR
ncbi:T9SS type B sorting domain-containing protein [Capnocytophaga canis]|uniref:T9SS type B sorting domain-containing protein n=1 Tax=Capnocytophaga canis TaxID=1848903 RepID=UPI001562D16F|nr:T9SS type B sorting domain-containing protein [Capnocytophaga canis]